MWLGGGDLRAPHFFATHAAQAVPQFVLAWERLRPTSATLPVATFLTLYAAFTIAAFVQAQGLGAAGIVILTFIVGLMLWRHPRPDVSPAMRLAAAGGLMFSAPIMPYRKASRSTLDRGNSTKVAQPAMAARLASPRACSQLIERTPS